MPTKTSVSPTKPRSSTAPPRVQMPLSRSLSANRIAAISDAVGVSGGRTTGAVKPSIQPMILKISSRFLDAMKRDDLKRLLDNPPSLSGEATQFGDGRNVKVVIAIVRDAIGNARPGILVQLRDGGAGTLLDHTRTNAGGVAVLRFPLKESYEGNLPDAVVEVLGSDLHEVLDVVPLAGSQFALAEFTVPELPPLVEGAKPGDPFTRIPTDFTPELCDEVSRILGDWEDPLMQNLSVPGDFRTRRTRLIKRFVVPRVGLERDETGAPRRYLVHMRQEWQFLGYTLGELQEVDSLDPGQTLDETTRSIQRTATRTMESLSNDVTQTLAQVQDTLSRASSIDTLVDVATSLHASTDTGASLTVAGGGGFIGIPGLFGVGGGAATTRASAYVRNSVLTHATTRTSTDTSLMVNSMLRSAQSRVNRSVRSAANTLRSITNQVVQNLDQVSPLLSRVTNLLRWGVYENYAVCTRVEDVVELKAVKVLDEARSGDLFSAQDIAEYEPFFAHGLLDPALRRHYASLRRAVDIRNAAERPITGVGFTVDYAAQYCGADLRVTVAGEDVVIPLHPGGRRATGWIHLPTPIPEEDLDNATMELTLRSDRCSVPRIPFTNFDDILRESARVQVTRATVRYASAPGANLHDTERIDGFEVRHASPSDSVDVPMRVPDPHVFPETNPLYLHINRNPTYYMGILLQAALEVPSLRDDIPQVANLFSSEHEVWRLPIAGFEGDRILVVGDTRPNDKFAEKLKHDIGAGTLVQIAAPGAYSEALQGLLQLTDAAGRIHPGLEPPLAPAMPPIAIVDLAGKTLLPVDGLGVTETVGGATGGVAGGATGGTGGGGLPVTVPGSG